MLLVTIRNVGRIYYVNACLSACWDASLFLHTLTASLFPRTLFDGTASIRSCAAVRYKPLLYDVVDPFSESVERAVVCLWLGDWPWRTATPVACVMFCVCDF